MDLRSEWNKIHFLIEIKWNKRRLNILKSIFSLFWVEFLWQNQIHIFYSHAGCTVNCHGWIRLHTTFCKAHFLLERRWVSCKLLKLGASPPPMYVYVREQEREYYQLKSIYGRIKSCLLKVMGYDCIQTVMHFSYNFPRMVTATHSLTTNISLARDSNLSTVR